MDIKFENFHINIYFFKEIVLTQNFLQNKCLPYAFVNLLKEKLGRKVMLGFFSFPILKHLKSFCCL